MDVYFFFCYNFDKGLFDYKNNMVWFEQKNGKWDCLKGWMYVFYLFFEVYWEIFEFVSCWIFDDKKQLFVFFNGDVIGYSFYVDFMVGWDEDVLQNIIDNCNVGIEGMNYCLGV